MTITADAPPAEAPGRPVVPRRSRQRLWIAVAAVVVLVAGAAITTTVWVRHYSAAAALRSGGGLLGWVGTDRENGRNVSLGAFNVLETEPRPHHSQAFEFWVYNPSSVTQTILGLRYPGAGTSEPAHVLVSTTDPDRLRGDDQPTFRSGPQAVPPHQYRAVRYVFRELACWSRGQSGTFTDVAFRVRVGLFTRTERVDFGGNTGFVLNANRRIC